jgi:hypothetical protein
MRNDETRHFHDLVAQQDEIEIERARRAGKRTLTATLGLYRQQRIEKRERTEIRRPDRCRVQKPRLVANHINWIGLERRRKPWVIKERRDPIARKREVCVAVTEIRPDANGDDSRTTQIPKSLTK